MASSTCGAFENSSRYALRPQAHSSHSILLVLVPEDGNSRRLRDVGCADGYLSHLFAERGFAVTAIDAPGSRRRAIPDGIRYIEADLDCDLRTIDGTSISWFVPISWDTCAIPTRFSVKFGLKSPTAGD